MEEDIINSQERNEENYQERNQEKKLSDKELIQIQKEEIKPKMRHLRSLIRSAQKISVPTDQYSELLSYLKGIQKALYRYKSLQPHPLANLDDGVLRIVRFYSISPQREYDLYMGLSVWEKIITLTSYFSPQRDFIYPGWLVPSHALGILSTANIAFEIITLSDLQELETKIARILLLL